MTTKHAIYVELDALLDTRLAVIAKLDPEAAERLVASPEYYKRDKDSFVEFGIDDETFQAAYQTRDAEILKHSVSTHLPFLLHNIVQEVTAQANAMPEAHRFDVDVNIFPYHLTDEERRLIELSVQRFCTLENVVRTVNIDYAALTPEMIKRRYGILLMYNFNEWLQLQPTLFDKAKIPRVVIMAPRLFYGERIESDSPDLADYQVRDPFFVTQKMMNLFVGLEFMEVDHFCPMRHWEIPSEEELEAAAQARVPPAPDMPVYEKHTPPEPT